MGQKANQTSVRLALKNTSWASEYIENVNSDATINVFQDLNIRKYLHRFFTQIFKPIFNNPTLYFNNLRDYVLENPKNEIELTILRDGIEKKIFLTPEVISAKDRFGNNYSSARIGVIGSQKPEHIELKKYGFISSIYRGTYETYNLSTKILSYLGKLIAGRESIDQMGGPIKIIQISGEISNYGMRDWFRDNLNLLNEYLDQYLLRYNQ